MKSEKEPQNYPLKMSLTVMTPSIRSPCQITIDTVMAAAGTVTVDRSATFNVIGEWIASFGKAFEGYRSAFVDNGIDGEAVFAGDVDDKWLTEQKVTAAHQRLIKRNVQKLIDSKSLTFI